MHYIYNQYKRMYLRFSADFRFQISNLIDKKSQAGPINHICLSFQYNDFLWTGRGAAAL